MRKQGTLDVRTRYIRITEMPSAKQYNIAFAHNLMPCFLPSVDMYVHAALTFYYVLLLNITEECDCMSLVLIYVLLLLCHKNSCIVYVLPYLQVASTVPTFYNRLAVCFGVG